MNTMATKREHVRGISGGKENAEIDNLIIFNLEYYKSEATVVNH